MMSLDITQYWMCEPRTLKAFVEKISGLNGEQLRRIDADDTEKKSAGPVTVTVAGATALIPVQGILLQRVPEWLEYYIKRGLVQVTGLDVIRQQVQMAAADPSVKDIRLLVHSPGGTVAGTMEAAEAIAAARQVKPVVAEIETMAASGGYYLASQASSIESNADGGIGSIGVYAVYYDMSKMYEEFGVKAIVISSGEHKGAGVEGTVITESQVKAVKEVIDDMAAHFVSAVASGRGIGAADVRALADGRMWLAPKAKKLRLIDTVQNGTVFKHLERKQNMSQENETKTAQDLEQVKADALKAGQAQAAARMKALREAFAGDLEFAMAQFDAGHDVPQAKAEYCDVLAARNKTLAEQNAALEAAAAKKQDAAKKQTGAAPVPHSASGIDGTEDGDGECFRGKVDQYMKDGLSKAKATAKAVKLHPDLHAAHLEAQTVGVV